MPRPRRSCEKGFGFSGFKGLGSDDPKRPNAATAHTRRRRLSANRLQLKYTGPAMLRGRARLKGSAQSSVARPADGMTSKRGYMIWRRPQQVAQLRCRAVGRHPEATLR